MKSADALRQQQQQRSNEGQSAERKDNDNRTAMSVHRTLNDATRRNKNVVVTGLPETGSAVEDRSEIVQLCGRNLSVKLRCKERLHSYWEKQSAACTCGA